MIRKIRCDTAMNFKPLNARKEYYMNEYLENQLNKSVVYQQLKDNCERNNQHEVLALVAKVGTFAVERLKTVIKNMPEFTLHDDTHIFNMLTIIGKLIPQENMRKLSTPDLFMLIVSVFLHDIGMAPDEKHMEFLSVVKGLFRCNINTDVKQILGKVNAALLKIKDMQQQPN